MSSSQKQRVITPNTQPQPRPAASAAYKDIRQTKEYKLAARRYFSLPLPLPLPLSLPLLCFPLSFVPWNLVLNDAD